MSVYDPACGSGGMLTESQNFIEEKYPASASSQSQRDIYLYGKEINDETYAICKSDMMIKGNNPENIKVGSTLSTDEFASDRFDFMLSNPPYGKSWASEQKNIKDSGEVIDPRFKVELSDYWGNKETVDATPRSSDGQLLFLMEMVSKMKDPATSAQGSRIASVHNGSSLFTGDAGGGESNIRRFIIENDRLDAIVQLPNNLFYNTGITTYIWLLNNNKPEARKGKVQLIDASLLFRKLRKNLGNKNCEFAPKHITQITQTYLDCAEVERELDANNDPIGIASQVFNNKDFGYYKVNIERPDRRKARFSPKAIAPLRFDKALAEVMAHVFEEHGDKVYGQGFLKGISKDILQWCEENDISINAKTKSKLLDEKYWQKLRAILEAASRLMQEIGGDEFDDFNLFKDKVDAVLKAQKIKLSAPEKNAILNAVSWYDESAEKVVKKIVKLSGSKRDELLDHLGCSQEQLADFGFYPTSKPGEYVTYEPSSDLRDSESVPLAQEIHGYFLEEVKPHVEEAWINLDSTKIGYEISFNKYFYRHKPLRSLEEVASDIIDLEQKAEGLIAQILGVELSGFESGGFDSVGFDSAQPPGGGSLGKVENRSLSEVENRCLREVENRCLSEVENRCLSEVENRCLSEVENRCLSEVEGKTHTPSEAENRSLSKVEGKPHSPNEPQTRSLSEVERKTHTHTPSEAENRSLSEVEGKPHSPNEPQTRSLSEVEGKPHSPNEPQNRSLSEVEGKTHTPSEVENRSLSKVEGKPQKHTPSEVENRSLSGVEGKGGTS